jgi:hypothetical protein
MRARALLIAALVVLAGCSGLDGSPETSAATDETTTAPETTEAATTTASTTTTTTAGQPTDTTERVEVIERGATLGDVNATAVWQRVGDLVSVDGPAPPPVAVQSGTANRTVTPPTFWQSFGASEYTYAWRSASGFYHPGDERVVLVRNEYTTDENLEVVLAHEFAHVYHDRELDALPENASVFVEHAVSEGAVEYVTWTYASRYTNATHEATRRTAFREGRPYTRYFEGGYYLGGQYARNHSDPDAPLMSLYETPPTTAEQILHDLPPGSEPPKPLTVRGVTGNDSDLGVVDVQRRGEAQLRFVMEYGLSRERAAEAAAGWGDDRSVHFQSTDANGFAWVVRWDSPDEAAAFEAAFAAFEANVSEPVALDTVGDEATVVFSGAASFVGNATASGTAGNVTVAAGH